MELLGDEDFCRASVVCRAVLFIAAGGGAFRFNQCNGRIPWHELLGANINLLGYLFADKLGISLRLGPEWPAPCSPRVSATPSNLAEASFGALQADGPANFAQPRWFMWDSQSVFAEAWPLSFRHKGWNSLCACAGHWTYGFTA